MCRPLTRREFLRYSAMAASTPIAIRALAPFYAGAANAVPMNLELVTLTESEAILTWFTGDPTMLDQYHRPTPVPADTVVYLDTQPLPPSPSPSTLVIDRNDQTPYHYVELTGLKPGQTYYYRCISNGLVAAPTAPLDFPHAPVGVQPPTYATGFFTAPLPPPGDFLFAMCWANDMHMGEMTSGLAYGNSSLPGGGAPPGFASDPSHPYTTFMAQAMVADAKARGAHLMILNGDLTSEAEPVNMAHAKQTLDVFGTYRRDYFVGRGNHDRAHSGTTWKACVPVAGNPDYNDCIVNYFFPDGHTYYAFDKLGLHFVCLDTVDQTTGSGAIPAGELEWLKADLAQHSHMPTLVFGHHPVTEQARVENVGQQPGFNLVTQDAVALEQALAGTSVVAVHNAHTHRNFRTTSPLAPNITFLEVGAVKEYPGGFTMLRVFSGGYAANFYKLRPDDARAWSELSRGEYLGLYPYYTFGELGDRNFTMAADFSDVAAYLRAHPGGGPVTIEEPGGAQPNTAAGAPSPLPALAAAGGALAAASLLPPHAGGGKEGGKRSAGGGKVGGHRGEKGVIRLRLLATAAFTAAVTLSAASSTAVVRADTNPPKPEPGGGGGTSQAFLDGCLRDPSALIDGNAPSWVLVYNTPAAQAAPAPRWVTGTVTSLAPQALAVHPSGDDLPSGHDDYDMNVNVIPDAAYDYLVSGHYDAAHPTQSTGNYASKNDEAYAAVHSELEGSSFPFAVRPQSGDRITFLGNWIWDCGHWGVPTEIFSPDYVLPKVGEPCMGNLVDLGPIFDPAQCHITGESTEFHPWRAMWDVAAEPDSPEGESQAKLYVSTDETHAGVVENCSHKFPPINGLFNPQQRVCAQTDPNWQDVSGDYSFYLAAPAKPSADAQLTYRAVDAGSSGAPAPTLAPEGNGVRVTFHLATAQGQALHMYYQVFAGWDVLPAAAVPAHLHVTLDKVEIHRAMDPGCTPAGVVPGCNVQSTSTNQGSSAPGEWNLYFDAMGTWGQVKNGEFDVNDGDVVTPNQAMDIYVPPGQGWQMLVTGRECDLQGLAAATAVSGMFKSCTGTGAGSTELSDTNDGPGTILDTYASAAASLGTHVRDAPMQGQPYGATCPKVTANPHGCYTLTYTVSQVADASTRVLTRLSSPNTGAVTPYPVAVLAGLGLAAVLVLGLTYRRRRRI